MPQTCHQEYKVSMRLRVSIHAHYGVVKLKAMVAGNAHNALALLSYQGVVGLPQPLVAILRCAR